MSRRSIPNQVLLAALAASLALAVRDATPAGAQSGAPKPKFGTFGFDSTGMDHATRPGDDFFRYANGTWLDHTEIPPDKAIYSLRIQMTDLVESRLHDLMEQAAKQGANPPVALEDKVGAFYRSFLDEERVEKLGASALERVLADVRAAKTLPAIAALMGRDNSDFEGTFFDFFIDVDLKNPRQYAYTLNQAGLGLPDRDYYLKEQFAAQKKQYESYVGELLRLVDWPEPKERARDIVLLETSIAEVSWTKTEERDPVATYNPMSPESLSGFAPDFPWKEFLAAAGAGKLDRVIVAEKSAFPRIAAIFGRTPVKTLQAWLAFTVADNAAPYLSKPFADASFEMRQKSLSGQLQQTARWKRAVHAVSGGDVGTGDRFDRFGNLSWGVGQLYAERYFPPESKAAIEALVLNLKAAFRTRLEKLDWMGPKTRAQALKKLDTYTIKVGYPDRQRDYSKLEIRADDLIGNVRRAAAADWTFYVNRQGGPVDRGDWWMTPQTNDAYNGSLRDIVFPAGILQPPMFDPAADPAINYGAVGGVIGHELTHGFDDQGRKLDAEGKLVDWWTPSDAKSFEARAAKLGAQYSSYEPVPGAKINGELTMGENIADLGGLTVGLEAYHASLKGKSAPVIGGLTGDQRVFLGWAQAWRGKARDDFVRRMVVSDPHSPRMYRVNGVVRNIDAWYAAFGVKPGDKLYLAPADRVHIW